MIYLITGPAGVGKSTISKMIAENLEKSVLIEGDDIYHLVAGKSYMPAWKEGNHLNFFWDNVTLLIKNALKFDYDVVFNYILNKKDIERIKNNFSNEKIKFVVLLVDEKTILERDKLRPEDCQMRERCLILLDNMKKAGFDKNNIIDTSNLTIDETYKIILNDNRFEIN